MIKPDWLRKSPTRFADTIAVRKQIDSAALNTVCRRARCPNMGECFSNGVATFMILGEKCSRACGFCSVRSDVRFSPPDPLEPERVAEAVAKLKLSHVVVTSVTRDDLPDGGSSHFAKTLKAIRDKNQSSTVEVLTPDFQGNPLSIDTVIEAKPDVYNHNVETVPRLYPKVRPKADYSRSLRLLERVKDKDRGIVTKSGMMLGFGETQNEVIDVMKDLREAKCDIITIGQYLRPTLNNLKVSEYVDPKIFEEFGKIGGDLGFANTFAGPFVRSSYHAGEILKGISNNSRLGAA